MESQFDNETYWHRSTRKGFSFDDDSTDNLFAKCTIGGILNDDTTSEASFDNSIDALRALNLNVSIKSIVSEEILKQILQEQSLDDRILWKSITLEEELKLLRRQIQTTLYNPSASSTTNKLMQGKQVPMEVFKSLHEKQELLNRLLNSGGGDAIIGVVLFLRKTLNTTNFSKVLKQQPKIVSQYLNYLKQREPQEAVEVMYQFNKRQNAALLQFQSTAHCQDSLVRKQNLQHILYRYATGHHGSGISHLYQQIFQSTLKLFEFVEKERHYLDKNVHMNSSPIEVLYACCSKHSNWKDQDIATTISPFRFCAEHQISLAQFEWTALNERAHAQAYADLEHVFERAPTWHSMRQNKFHISFSLQLAIQRLSELGAPPSVLYILLSKMNNTNEKLQLAQGVKCNKAVIDALVSLKDTAQLTQLRGTLKERSEEQFYCDKALKSLQTKRWSTDIRLKI